MDSGKQRADNFFFEGFASWPAAECIEISITLEIYFK